MAVLETETHGQIFVMRMNRPESLNALNYEMRCAMAEAWTEFEASKVLEVAIFTGSGRGFCAGEDMKEALKDNTPGGRKLPMEDPFSAGKISKPIIGAINGFAMGGGFMLVEGTDLRVAADTAIFEVSEAKRWLLGGYNHGHIANVASPVALEMAMGYRFTAQRFHEIGFLNRVVPAADLMDEAMKMAEHLMTLPPAARVNTLHIMRQMRPSITPAFDDLGTRLHAHGDLSDLIESRAAFAEKRKPNFKGWLKPEDRYRLPQLEE